MDNLEPNSTFPFKRLRVPGIVQVGLGVLSTLAGTIILALHLIKDHHNEIKMFDVHLPVLPILTAPIYCGVWFIFTGTIGACATNPKCLRIGFLLLSIIGAIIIAPAQMLACAAFILAYLNLMLKMTHPFIVAVWVLFALGGFFAVLQFFVAIVSACICCCCVQAEPSGQAYAMVPTTQDKV